ncbi:hypothetical protein KIPB_004586 [Kipferlia bialata]|uniref:Uncharacterized protein n=1 Tax=Kipferlia bialata TaxID=797122 RepID=A0A391NKX3_9EUKA|nr:hypothetical protein KIPB_004586 [Kipferlia bialata]|eukprot:g4586.t1
MASSYCPDLQIVFPDGGVLALTDSLQTGTYLYIPHIRPECEYPDSSQEWARDPSLSEIQRIESALDESDTEESGSDSDSSSFVA